MTRIDEAAKTIIRCMPTRTHQECAVDAARALDADGLLVPDLPEPDMAHDDPEWQDQYEDEWGNRDAPEYWDASFASTFGVGVFPGMRVVHSWTDDGEPFEPATITCARRFAYALLAAADYAERNQEC